MATFTPYRSLTQFEFGYLDSFFAIEVVSPGAEQIERDYIEKVAEYQERGVSEYWIVDPIEQKITVLVLDQGSYTKTVFSGHDAIASSTFPQLNLNS